MFISKSQISIKFISIFQKLYFFPLKLRKSILFLIDFCLIFFSMILTAYLSYVSNWKNYLYETNYMLFALFSFLSIVFFFFTGQYKSITRFNGSITFYYSLIRSSFVIIILAILSNYFVPGIYKLRFWLNLSIIIPLLINIYRFILRDIFFYLGNSGIKTNRVVIYGADTQGAQLANYLNRSGYVKVVAILDSSSQVLKRNINSIPIMSVNQFLTSGNNYKIEKVYLAKKSLNRSEKFNINKVFMRYGIKVFKVSSVTDFTNEKKTLDEIKSISIDDLLGRDAVNPDSNLLGPGIKNKCICVTGAGGSIGGELVEQLKNLKPSKIVIIDQNEHSLYLLNQKIKNLNIPVEIIPVLGSVSKKIFLENIIFEFKVDIIFHAAAYKHVPLVENNPIEGLYNNVFSTKNVCEAAYKNNVEKVILISTDKAVRPTNIMGASKRISELIVQGFSEMVKNDDKSECCFSIVRFGNVLGSSGSVVPLFKKQISNGGPITLTHPEIIRYFMSIREAAQLVIQSAFLSRGGEVFLLDMGKPIKIKDLAEQMIILSGLTIKDDNNPNGDIKIVISGLRPGEKLFEELLLGDDSRPTKHPLIFKANEKFIKPYKLFKTLDKFEIALNNRSVSEILEILKILIPESDIKKL